MIRRILLLATILLAQAIPATALSRDKDLDRWLDRDLIPYVNQQLVVHPRFKNETVMFVILKDNSPASTSNALALSLRDRVLEAALDTQGVSIGWHQGRSGNSLESSSNECLQDEVHYYVGIELTQELDSSYSVNVRALDLEDRTWVSGFGKRWQGRLSTIQRQAMRQDSVDETFLGAREVPFTLAQTDLLASHLAYELSCTLMQQVEDDYIVTTRRNGSANAGLEETVELIGNNLANRQALVLTKDSEKTNAVLSGKAHRIDGALYQYWLTITPASDADGLAALSTSAYVVLPHGRPDIVAATSEAPVVRTERVTALRSAPSTISIPNAGKESLIGGLQIAAPVSVTECHRPCSMLRTRANADSIVFFLEHQANHGLVRLSGEECRQRTVATIARNGETVSFPIAKTSTDSHDWTETYDWALAPDMDTFYAVVVTDANTARQMANHIDNLPLRCSSALRPGLDGESLNEWLATFALLAARSAEHVDWRAIKVRDVM